MNSALEANVRPEDFKYKTLDPTQHEIRVLDVGPGLVHDPMVTTVRHVSLAATSKPNYEAVSYVWGDSSVREHVMLDGRWVDVPSSSAEALRNLRFQDTSRTLWIDAICIDQADVEERNQQVSLMGQIYSNTLRTLVWLGEEDEDTRLAFRHIDTFVRQAKHALGAIRVRDRARALLDKEAFEPLTEDAALVICRVYSRPWFHRFWVIQEVALAPECICFCGTSQRPMLDVLRSAIWFVHKFDFGVNDIVAQRHVEDVYSIWQAVDRQKAHAVKSRRERLYSVLAGGYTGFQASNPRDHVYALLGLTIQWPDFTLPRLLIPDYTKTVVEVFRDATFAFIECDRTLGPLHHANHLRTNDVDELDLEWPSWVPHWDRSPEHSPSTLKHVPQHGPRSSSQSFGVWRREDPPNVLCITGSLVDRITAVDFAWTGPDVFWIDRYDSLFTETESLRSVLAGCSDPQSVSAVARTLCGTSTYHWTSVSVTDRQELGDLLQELVRHSKRRQWPSEGPLRDLLMAIFTFIRRRRFFVMSTGFGMGPYCTREKDVICVAKGSRAPLVLRPYGSMYRLVGECYIDNLMQGEAMQKVEDDEAKLETIVIR